MSQISYKPENGDTLPIADLHFHSNFSDGESTPSELVAMAIEKQIAVLALTDHDTVAGLAEMRLSASGAGIHIVSGTELTCYWGRRSVHVVGLGFDDQDPALVQYMKHLDGLRLYRAGLIAQKLIKQGLPDLLARALELANKGQVGRPHFAQALVEAGVVNTEAQAFNRYLGSGKVGDVKVDWPELSEAIAIIKNAGGITVLAHPTKYNLTFTKIRLLVDAFFEQGGDAIEISYPGIESGHILQLDKLAKKHNLMVSAGSDFHKKQFHWTGLGKYPGFSTNNEHVLTRLLLS